jgi:epoxyqueuosine reductase
LTPLMRALADEARAAGFDDIGVCPADVPMPDREHVAAAFDEGRMEPLSWMAATRDQRLDVRVRVPSAKSVVVVVQSYWQGDHADHVDADALAQGAKVARYAWGQDYHHVLRRKLRRLRKWLLARVPDAKVAPFNDVDAVTERAWAVACGLGFVGKSGMFISRRLGTWTFLGGLLTDVDLHGGAVPARVSDACGSCTACLDACPPQAILAPRVVDARRCLTTWNVEEPTDPRGDAFAGHGWAVGCDVCQEVCPWNKFAVPTREPRYAPRHVVVDPDADAPDVAGTPLARPGRENLLRLAARARGRPATAGTAAASHAASELATPLPPESEP